MAQTDSIRDVTRSRQPLSAWFGVVLLFFLFGVVVFAVIGPSPRTDTYEQARAKKRAENLKTLHEEGTKALTGYAWIDKNKGTVRVPIERAMELTVAELKDKKPGPGGPIVVAGAAGAAPQASPAASASPSPAGKKSSASKASSPSASGTPKATSVEGPNSENRGQPAAAGNPPAAKPETQPGANATPAASAASAAAAPAVSPSPAAAPSTAGSPLPVRGKESPSPSPH